MSATNCHPKLFVYDLEEAWRDPTQHQLPDQIGEALVKTTALLSLGSGRARTEIHSVGQFALGEIIYQRAKAYRCRTSNATDADLFFIPTFSARFLNGSFSTHPSSTLAAALENVTVHAAARGGQAAWSETLRALNERAKRWRRLHPDGKEQTVSALRRLGGLDHFMVQPRNGAALERVPFVELRKPLTCQLPMRVSFFPSSQYRKHADCSHSSTALSSDGSLAQTIAARRSNSSPSSASSRL